MLEVGRWKRRARATVAGSGAAAVPGPGAVAHRTGDGNALRGNDDKVRFT